MKENINEKTQTDSKNHLSYSGRYFIRPLSNCYAPVFYHKLCYPLQIDTLMHQKHTLLAELLKSIFLVHLQMSSRSATEIVQPKTSKKPHL